MHQICLVQSLQQPVLKLTEYLPTAGATLKELSPLELEQTILRSEDLIILYFEKYDAGCQALVEYLTDTYFSSRILVILRTVTPEIIVTALQDGADECLGERCFSGLLRIKICQLLVWQKLQPATYLRAGAIELCPATGELLLSGSKARLRRRESQILHCLLQYKNRVVTRQHLVDHVWAGEEDYPTTVTIDVYVRRLRMALKQYQGMLRTIRGFGYCLSDASSAGAAASAAS